MSSPTKCPRLRTERERNDLETEQCLESIPTSQYPYPMERTIQLAVCLDHGPNGRLCIYTPQGMVFVERKHIQADIAPFSD